MRGPALPIVAFFPFIATLSGGRRVLWRASPSLRNEAGGGRSRPALHCETQTRWSVRTCINALCCRAHHQAEWLLFLDFNGGGWWWLAGAGCASCYNQQQLRQPAASSKRSAAAATPGKSDRAGRARARVRAGQGSDNRADTRLAAACTLPVPPRADI